MQTLVDLCAGLAANQSPCAEVSDSQCQQLLAVGVPALREFPTAHPEAYQRLLWALVQTLNSEEVSVKRKTNALLFLMKAALEAPSSRSVMLTALKGLSSSWEQVLTDREAGRAEFGASLGRLHEYMLVLLCRVSDYELSAAQLLEFASGKLGFALELLSLVIKVPSYEEELRLNCAQLLLGFTRPATYFEGRDGSGSTQDFSEKVNFVVQQCSRLNLLPTVVDALSPALGRALNPATHGAVQAFLGFLLNTYAFSTTGSTAFRQSLLVSTQAVQRLLLPYIGMCLAASGDSPKLEDVALRGAQRCLSALCLASFRMGSHGATLRALNTVTAHVLQPARLPLLRAHPSVLAQLLQFNANMDSLAGEQELASPSGKPPPSSTLPEPCTSASLVGAVAQTISALSQSEVLQVFELLGKTGAAPVAHDTASYQIISNLCLQTIEKKRDSSESPLSGGNSAQLLEDLAVALDQQLQALETGKEELELIKAALAGSVGSAGECASPS
eukprot:RCo050777